MLKTRVISAVLGLALLFAAVMISVETLAIAVFILSVAAIYEFNNAVSNAGCKPIKWVGYISCGLILAIGTINGSISIVYNPMGNLIKLFRTAEDILLFMFFILLLLFIQQIFSYPKYNIADISVTICGILYVVFMFLFIVLTRGLKDGAFFTWIIFIGAWATDTFAYFGGVTLGKRKLIPAVSPNKTVEGSISGVIGAVAALCLYGFLVGRNISYVPYFHYIIMGILCGIISQVGDLTASTIKRYTKIKDYGNIIPGHGGVLDRFDSVLLVAPTIYFYIYYIVLR
ncbi:MAG TPA: phosphatidate cytidylyltransferase [Clostridiaceae bacterium]|nr:phosphatidate cytidylyltransferase [Clostridiaceae bacterium]